MGRQFGACTRNRRGVTLAFVALLLFVFLGLAALSVDLGMLYGARTEAQRAADAGALAGGAILMDAPTADGLARSTAIEWAGRNSVNGTGPTVLDDDVDVVLSEGLVRVRVLRTVAHLANQPIRNIFARALGFRESDVAASAAAQVRVAGGVNCPLPFLLVDRWWETAESRLAEPGDEWGAADIYNEGGLSANDWAGSPTLPTGYGTADLGRVLGIRPRSPQDTPVPGSWNTLNLDAFGFNEVRDWIQGCPNPDMVFSRGMPVETQQGGGTGPIRQGFTSLIGQDPTAFWGTTTNSPNAPPATPASPGGCVMRPGDVDENGNLICVSSPRIKPMLMIPPDEAPTDPGNQTVHPQNFVGVFVICIGDLQPNQSSCTGNFTAQNGSVWVRFVRIQGIGSLAPGVDDGSLTRSLQLVE